MPHSINNNQNNALVRSVIQAGPLMVDDLKNYTAFVDTYAGYNLRHALRSEMQINTFSEPAINAIFKTISAQWRGADTFSQLWIENCSTHQLKLNDKTVGDFKTLGSGVYSILFSIIGTSKDVAIGARSVCGLIGSVLYAIENKKCKDTSANIVKLLKPFEGDPRINNTFANMITRLVMDWVKDPIVRKQILDEYRSLATKGMKKASGAFGNLKKQFSGKSNLELYAARPRKDHEEQKEIEEAGTLIAQAVVLAMLTTAGDLISNRKKTKQVVQAYHEYVHNFDVEPNDMEISQTAMLMALREIFKDMQSKVALY
jgi:hypothetical protein